MPDVPGRHLLGTAGQSILRQYRPGRRRLRFRRLLHPGAVSAARCTAPDPHGPAHERRSPGGVSRLGTEIRPDQVLTAAAVRGFDEWEKAWWGNPFPEKKGATKSPARRAMWTTSASPECCTAQPSAAPALVDAFAGLHSARASPGMNSPSLRRRTSPARTSWR